MLEPEIRTNRGTSIDDSIFTTQRIQCLVVFFDSSEPEGWGVVRPSEESPRELILTLSLSRRPGRRLI